ncbi:hypothetical protein ACI3QN_12455, partial [Propionibacterium freudenreichii]|uniref:hypothetical protein n=1 Tax=Propionibacterium freudenreichii TaxID=1744 RepID=UPI0038548D3F
MTILFCFSAIALFCVFWEVNKDFPAERIYSAVLPAGMLFSVVLSLLRWHFRLKPQFWQLSA